MPLFQLRLAGYGLLVITAINSLLRLPLSPALLTSVTGRLQATQALISLAPWLLLALAMIFIEGNRCRSSREQIPVVLLHRLLLPLTIGYLLLVPLLIRDGLGYNGAVQGEIDSQRATYRQGRAALLAQVRPLTTPLAVARVVQRYPGISLALDPTDSAPQLKAKLSEALRNGEASLLTRLDGIRRARLEGLFQRSLAQIGMAVTTALVLVGLRRQNQEAMAQAGYEEAAAFFRQDLRPGRPRSGRRRGRVASSTPAIPSEWLGCETVEESLTPPDRAGR